MFRNRCFDMNIGDLNEKNTMNKENYTDNMNTSMPGCEMEPVMECPQERCCHREIHHEVRHVVPVNTRIINHHIIHHKYVPMYTCCEENVCMNVRDC